MTLRANLVPIYRFAPCYITVYHFAPCYIIMFPPLTIVFFRTRDVFTKKTHAISIMIFVLNKLHTCYKYDLNPSIYEVVHVV